MLVIGGTLSLGCSVDAQPAPATESAPATETVTASPDSSPVERWVRQLRQIDGFLKREDWSTAGQGTESLLVEMTDTIQGGNRAGALMAMGTLFRAIAAAGLEREEDAMWDWYAAQSLHGDYAQVELDGYGEAGAWLLRRGEADTATAGQVVDLSQPEMADPSIVAPTRIGGPAPVYPVALKQACTQGVVRARLLVDSQGQPTQPRVLDSPGGPPMALAALEAMRLWRYEPARLDGSAIPVYITTEVPFTLDGCTPNVP